MVHKPVLLKEAIEALNLKPGTTVVDGTLGAGGHSMVILEKIVPGGKLISIDLDEKSVRNFEKIISVAKRKLIGKAWVGVADNYSNIKKIVRGSGMKSADAVLVDLGFSSDQIEDPARGFSFLRNGPLDMRYSPETQQKTAADIVNEYSEKDLARILRELGEEKFAGRIAREIRKRREIGKIKETEELVEVISKAVPAKYKHGKIHFATKIFQALRIETNQELENLKKFLLQAVEVLASEGILAIISFHSLEDRIVKNFFREVSRGCNCPPNFPKCVCGKLPQLEIITKKPITASTEEIRDNSRARSAKLRVAKKI